MMSFHRRDHGRQLRHRLDDHRGRGHQAAAQGQEGQEHRGGLSANFRMCGVLTASVCTLLKKGKTRLTNKRKAPWHYPVAHRTLDLHGTLTAGLLFIRRSYCEWTRPGETRSRRTSCGARSSSWQRRSPSSHPCPTWLRLADVSVPPARATSLVTLDFSQPLTQKSVHWCIGATQSVSS